MTIPIDIDPKTESTLREQAVRLNMEPTELAGELLRQVVENEALLTVLSAEGGARHAGRKELVVEWSRIAKQIFTDDDVRPQSGNILQFGMFRGELGELSDEDFKLAEFAGWTATDV